MVIYFWFIMVYEYFTPAHRSSSSYVRVQRFSVEKSKATFNNNDNKHLFITINLSWLWNLVSAQNHAREIFECLKRKIIIKSRENNCIFTWLADRIEWASSWRCFQILNKINVHVHCSVCNSYTIWLVLKCLECVSFTRYENGAMHFWAMCQWIYRILRSNWLLFLLFFVRVLFSFCVLLIKMIFHIKLNHVFTIAQHSFIVQFKRKTLFETKQ